MQYIIWALIAILVINLMAKYTYMKLETKVLNQLGFSNWDLISYCDAEVTVKSRQALEKYDDIKFFKDNREELERAASIIKRKNEVARILNDFLENNEYKKNLQYRRLKNRSMQCWRRPEHTEYMSSISHRRAII